MGESLFASRKQREELRDLLLRILREDPEQFGIKVDEWGFVSLEQLKLVVRTVSNWATPRQIEEVIGDGSHFERWQERVKAVSGHRYMIRPEPEEVIPPEILYHGLPQLMVSSVTKYGLKPLGRRFIFLAETVDEAWYQGGKVSPSPVIIAVSAKRAHQAGVKFFRSERDYLCQYIPAEYISLKI